MERVLTSIITGLLVGWVVRTAARGRSFGWFGDLTIGTLGAMFGGFLTRRFGILITGGLAAEVALSFFGANAMFAAVRVLQRLGVRSVWHSAAALPAEVDLQLRRLTELQRRLFGATLGRPEPLTNTNQAFAEQMTFGERVADRVATFGGSWTFIGLFLTCMLAWMVLNEELGTTFDPYPFILLNLVLSCLAALQAPVIMMSQNRQAQKDRLDAQNDYRVNVRSELQIAALHEKLDLAREQHWARTLDLLEAQQAQIARLERLLASAGPSPQGSDPHA